MKPGIRIKVDTGEGAAANVKSSKNRITYTMGAGDESFFALDKPGAWVHITSLAKSPRVTVKNELSVPLTMETTLRDGTELDDVLKANKAYLLPPRAQLMLRI